LQCEKATFDIACPEKNEIRFLNIYSQIDHFNLPKSLHFHLLYNIVPVNVFTILVEISKICNRLSAIQPTRKNRNLTNPPSCILRQAAQKLPIRNNEPRAVTLVKQTSDQNILEQLGTVGTTMFTARRGYNCPTVRPYVRPELMRC
jgi:hypothetical protein